MSPVCCLFVCFWRDSPQWAMASSFTRFLDYTQRRATVGRTLLDKLSARRRDLYLKTHNTHNRQISMPPVGNEPTVSAGERPQTYALDRAASGTGPVQSCALQNSRKFSICFFIYEFVKFYVYPQALVCCSVCNWMYKWMYIIQPAN